MYVNDSEKNDDNRKVRETSSFKTTFNVIETKKNIIISLRYYLIIELIYFEILLKTYDA